jgi:hypothetical protein
MKLEAKHLISHAQKRFQKDDDKGAIEALLLLSNVLGYEDIHKQLLRVLSLLNELVVHEQSGTMDREFASLQKSRLRLHVTSIMQSLASVVKLQDFSLEINTTTPLKPKVKEWMEDLLTPKKGMEGLTTSTA